LPQVTDSLLTINGPRSPGITIDGGSAVQVMQVASGSTLKLNNLIIARGFTHDAGGGILNLGTLTVTNSTFSGNTAHNSFFGGSIFNEGTLTCHPQHFLRQHCSSTVHGDGPGTYQGVAVLVLRCLFKPHCSHISLFSLLRHWFQKGTDLSIGRRGKHKRREG
jgi:hypothetical protein